MRETTVFTILLMLYLAAMSHLARSLQEVKREMTGAEALDAAEEILNESTSNKWEP